MAYKKRVRRNRRRRNKKSAKGKTTMKAIKKLITRFKPENKLAKVYEFYDMPWQFGYRLGSRNIARLLTQGTADGQFIGKRVHFNYIECKYQITNKGRYGTGSDPANWVYINYPGTIRLVLAVISTPNFYTDDVMAQADICDTSFPITPFMPYFDSKKGVKVHSLKKITLSGSYQMDGDGVDVNVDRQGVPRVATGTFTTRLNKTVTMTDLNTRQLANRNYYVIAWHEGIPPAVTVGGDQWNNIGQVTLAYKLYYSDA